MGTPNKDSREVVETDIELERFNHSAFASSAWIRNVWRCSGGSTQMPGGHGIKGQPFLAGGVYTEGPKSQIQITTKPPGHQWEIPNPSHKSNHHRASGVVRWDILPSLASSPMNSSKVPPFCSSAWFTPSRTTSNLRESGRGETPSKLEGPKI